jgi:hypothetical protein
MNRTKWFTSWSLLSFMVLAFGCGGGTSSNPTTTTPAQSGSVFVSGTDAPLPSVVSFQVDITGITVSDGINPPVSVLNGTQTVDFARFDGLHTLLDLNTIPTGSYTSATVTLANPQIGYLNVTTPQSTPADAPNGNHA